MSRSESSEVLVRLRSAWPQNVVPKAKNIKVFEVEEDKLLLILDDIVAVQTQKIILPFLGGKREVLERFPSVTVDTGAVRFVCNGARVMRPGITNFDFFKKGDIVVVKDQVHNKALAVGIAIEDSERAKTIAKGHIIENLHYVSDKMWEAYKEI